MKRGSNPTPKEALDITTPFVKGEEGENKPRIGRNEGPIKDLTGFLRPEEIERIITACPNSRDRLLLTMLYHTGRRVSELLELTPADIDHQEKMIRWHILKKRNKDKHAWKPVPSQTINDLLEFIGHQGFIGNQGVGGVGWNDRVFPISRQRVFQIVRAAGKRVGIERVGQKKIHPHHFRHSYAVNVVRHIENAGDIRKLQMNMEHSNMTMTVHYLQFDPREGRELVEKSFAPKSKIFSSA